MEKGYGPSVITTVIEPDPGRLRNPVKRYLLATRLPFLLAAVLSCLVGLASAIASGVEVEWLAALLTLSGALLLHAAANVLNDYYDSLNGADDGNTGRLYPFTGGSRFIQNGVLSREQMARFGVTLLSAGVGVGLYLIWKGSGGLLWIGLIGVPIIWAYSAPPLSLNSRGLGELCVFIAFGPLITIGADYVQRDGFALLPLLLAIPYGLLVANLLYINQFPDREADARAGKRHLVVRLGARRGRWGYPLLIAVANLWLLLLVVAGVAPVSILLALLALPPGVAAAAILLRYAGQPERLAPAIRLSILSMLLHGVLLSLGLVIA